MAKQASIIDRMPYFVRWAWIQEGTLSLMQKAKVAAALARLRDATRLLAMPPRAARPGVCVSLRMVPSCCQRTR
jgi:hypothetical protein